MNDIFTPQVIVGLGSAIIAFGSLGLATYVGYLTRRHFRYLARPIVNLDTDISPFGKRHAIYVHNCGPGVAIIKSWGLYIDDKKLENLDKLASRALSELLGATTLIEFTHYFQGDALPSGQRIEIIGTNVIDGTEDECKIFQDRLKKVKIVLEYASVYEELWTKSYDGKKEHGP